MGRLTTILALLIGLGLTTHAYAKDKGQHLVKSLVCRDAGGALRLCLDRGFREVALFDTSDHCLDAAHALNVSDGLSAYSCR